MRTPILFLCSALIYPVLPAQEEVPVRRRPRIRVYDQRANVVTGRPPVEESREAELALEKKIRSESGAPSVSGGPVDFISMRPLTSVAAEAVVEKDDEEESWVTPQDFLLEEDRMEGEDLLEFVEKQKQQSSEMEITDWDNLQKSMIKEALQSEQESLSDEEMNELSPEEDSGEDTQTASGGLEMEEIAPVQGVEDLPGELSDVPLRDALNEVGGFSPVLQPARQMNGEIRLPARERDPRMELSGSRGRLDAITSKWEKPAERSSSSPGRSLTSQPFSSFERVAPPLPRDSGLRGLSRSNPVTDPQPLTRTPAALPAAAPPPPVAGQDSMLRRNDYRLRSRLGTPPGP